MFDNDNPMDRRALITALSRQGLGAFEWDSGRGTIHVCVPLVAMFAEKPQIEVESNELRQDVELALQEAVYEAYLYIMTNSLQTPCEIGVLGAYPDGEHHFASNNWRPVETLEEAVTRFQDLWEERDAWVRAFMNKQAPD
jgi:hypothetical protein